MPEGFASIDDLKVAVTASTEGLEAGLATAKGMVDKFSSEGTMSLGRFDGALGKVGASAANVRGSLSGLGAGAQAAMALVGEFLEKAEGIAKMAGLETEFGDLKAAIMGFGESLSIGVTAPLEALAARASGVSDIGDGIVKANASLIDSGTTATAAVRASAAATGEAKVEADQLDYTVKGVGTSAVAASAGMDMLAASTKSAASAKDDLQKPFGTGEGDGLLGVLINQARQARAVFEGFASDGKKSVDALKGDVASLTQEFNRQREMLEDVRQGTFSSWLFGQTQGGIIKELDAIGQRIEKLKAELATRPVADKGEFDKEIEGLEKQAEALEQKVRLFDLAAGDAARLVAEEKALLAIGYEMEELSAGEQERLKAKLDKIKETTDEMTQLNALKSVTDAIQNLEREAETMEFQARMVGKTADEVARLTAEFKIAQLAKQKDIELTDEWIAKQTEATDRLVAASAAKRAADAMLATDKAVDAIRDQVAGLELQVEMYGQSAGAIAAASAEQRIWNQAARDGRVLSNAQIDALQDEAMALEQLTDAKAANDKSKTFERDMKTAEAEVDTVRRKIETLFMEAGATAEMNMQAKLLAAARRNNIDLSDAEIERINAIAKAYGEATRAAKEQEQALAAVREVGTIVARSLDQAFSTWTKGGKLDFRDMVDSMLRDLARLAFQMAVIRPLFGGGNSGNGLIGGLLGQFLGGGAGGGIGSWQTTSVPAMASGGTMSAGVPTLVGERGPELVIPRGGERVVPNHALGYGGGSPNVVVNITAPSGTSATETGRRGNADGGMTMDILIESLDGALGQRLADGASTFGDAMQSTFGLSRAAGAR